MSVDNCAVVLLGHVDHGKSTVVGRLLADTGGLPEETVRELARVSTRRGVEFEWSFALDALQAERDQAVTIDSTYARVSVEGHQVVLIDAPGHKELLTQTVSGAAQARVALLVVDASQGVTPECHRHPYLARFLGVRTLLVAANKMDLVGFARDRFDEIDRWVRSEAADLGLDVVGIVPVAARDGDNLARRSARMPWYGGPTVLEALTALPVDAARQTGPLRFTVQDVYRVDGQRIVVGRVESGVLRTGETLLFSPSGRRARVRSIERWNSPPRGELATDEVAGLTLEPSVFIERGEVASLPDESPAIAKGFRAHVLWFDPTPLETGASLSMRIGTAEAAITVQTVERGFDLDTLAPVEGGSLRGGEVAWMTGSSRTALALDTYGAIPRTGRAVLVRDSSVAGAALIDAVHADAVAGVDCLCSAEVSAAARTRRNGHGGAVIWLTGLSAAGKSTIATGTERQLFDCGYSVYVLDGDRLRQRINADLGFSATDRRENVRRVGEIAALFADAGFVVLTALISPTEDARDKARCAAGGRFHEVFIDASLAACERRDPRGLYQRARGGEIREFTGVTMPYEVPSAPELVIDTERLTQDEAIATLVAYIQECVPRGLS